MEFKKFQATSKETFIIETPDNEDVEVELTCMARLIQISQINHEEILRKGLSIFSSNLG